MEVVTRLLKFSKRGPITIVYLADLMFFPLISKPCYPPQSCCLVGFYDFELFFGSASVGYDTWACSDLICIV